MTPERARQSVDWLFKKFALHYGRLWLDAYAQTGLSRDEVAAGWAEELIDYTEQEVVRGSSACKSSKFPPTLPAFLQMCRPATASNRPAGDEAWAIAIRAAKESETVVWTTEICEAWMVCQPVFKAGDEIGARMAFRAAYDRITADARVMGQPAVWVVSQGHDPEKRAIAIEAACVAGLLPAPVVEQFGPLLESRNDQAAPSNVAEKLAQLRAALTGRPETPRQRGETDRERTARLKQAAAEQIARAQGAA